MSTKIPMLWWAAWSIVNAVAQGQSLSPLQLLPGDVAIGPAWQDQNSPFIARGSNAFLAVWADRRAVGSGSDIWAARFDAAGVPLDAVPFPVSQAPGDQVMPRAVWNGANWLVVWESQEPTVSYYAMEVMGARVSPQGAVLDPTPIRVTPYQYSSTFIYSATSDGTNWLVIAQGASAGEAAVLGFRISPAGIVLDPGGVVLLPETYYLRAGLEAGFAGDEYLLLWTEWNAIGLDDVYAQRLTPTLAPLDVSPIVVAASTDYDVDPRVASDGTNFFVAYERYNTCCGAGGRVFGTRVSHQGLVGDLAGVDISGDVGITTGRRPCVGWDGANWFVAWVIPSISVARVSPSGTVLNPGGLPIDNASVAFKEEPQIAAAPGGGARVVWTDYRAGGFNPRDVFSAAVAANGQPAAGACVSVGAPSQLVPRLAANGTGYLAVFLSAVSSGQRVLAQRLDAGGNPLDAQPFEITPLGPNILNPAVAANGSLYLVVWEDRGSSTIYGRRVQANGVVLDATPLVIMPGNTPDVAAMGDTFLVVDTHAPANPQNRFAFARRVRGTDGALLDAAPVAIGGNFALIPRVTAFAGRWLATWEGHPTHDDTAANVYAAFVSTNGVADVQFAIIEDGYYVRFHYQPALAAGETNALVLWTDPRFGNDNWNVYGRRVLPDSTVLDLYGPGPILPPPLPAPPTYPGFAFTTARNNQVHPAIAWSGSEYVAAWEDPHANTFFLDARTDLFAARVTGAGVVLDANGFAVAEGPLPEISPALAGVNGVVVCAGAIFTDTPPYTSLRIGVRTLGAPAAVPPQLKVARAGQSLILSWPTNALGFSLESMSPSTPGARWSPVSLSPDINGTDYSVNVPMTNGSALFRLSRS